MFIGDEEVNPKGLRDIADTQDIVQDAMLQTFRNLHGFEYRGEGGFHAYLRQSVLHRVKAEIRRKVHRPALTALDSGMEADDLSPLEHTYGVRKDNRLSVTIRVAA